MRNAVDTLRKLKCPLTLVALGCPLLQASFAACAVITAGPGTSSGVSGPDTYAYNSSSGAFTYTYNAYYNYSATTLTAVDPNVAQSSTGTFSTEVHAAGDISYYNTLNDGTTTSPYTCTFSYTFSASAGNTFVGNATIKQQSLIRIYTGETGNSVVGTVSLNNGTPTQFYSFDPSNTVTSNVNNFTDYTPTSFSVNGASTFTITYTLTNVTGSPSSDGNGAPNFVEVMRDQGSSGTNTDNEPVVITGMTTTNPLPEPAAASLIALASAGTLLRRRRRSERIIAWGDCF